MFWLGIMFGLLHRQEIVEKFSTTIPKMYISMSTHSKVIAYTDRHTQTLRKHYTFSHTQDIKVVK